MKSMIPVSIGQNSFSILKMPAKYRKFLAPRDKTSRREGEILIHKQPAGKRQMYLRQYASYVIQDEKDKETYQTQQFNEDQLPPADRIILIKGIKNGQTIYSLTFADTKLDCFKFQDEKDSQRRFAELDKSLDARRKQHEYERIAERPKELVNSIPNYKQESSSDSEEKPKKHTRNQHRLDSDEDRKRKKVKLDSDSSQSYPESVSL